MGNKYYRRNKQNYTWIERLEGSIRHQEGLGHGVGDEAANCGVRRDR